MISAAYNSGLRDFSRLRYCLRRLVQRMNLLLGDVVFPDVVLLERVGRNSCYQLANVQLATVQTVQLTAASRRVAKL